MFKSEPFEATIEEYDDSTPTVNPESPKPATPNADDLPITSAMISAAAVTPVSTAIPIQSTSVLTSQSNPSLVSQPSPTANQASIIVENTHQIRPASPVESMVKPIEPFNLADVKQESSMNAAASSNPLGLAAHLVKDEQPMLTD